MTRNDPIFITGVYRSGTTILSRILDAHPSLDITYDSVNYFRFIIKEGLPASQYKEIIKVIYDRLQDRYKIVLPYPELVHQVEMNDDINHAVIYATVMEYFFGNSGRRWGEKTLLEWTNIPTFLKMYPQGKTIHVVRDPRDVIASYKNMTFETGEKYLDAIFACMDSMNTAWRYKDEIPKEKYLLFIYEEFIADKGKCVKKICDFLNIDFDKEMLNCANYTDLAGKPFQSATHSSFPEDITPPKNRWLSKLTPYEIDMVEGFLSSQLELFGYTISDSFAHNSIKKFLDTLKKTPLLANRFDHYMTTGQGVEAYPSNPTDKKNWGDDTVKRGQGAALAYRKREQ
jgi:hypothetical protein